MLPTAYLWVRSLLPACDLACSERSVPSVDRYVEKCGNCGARETVLNWQEKQVIPRPWRVKDAMMEPLQLVHCLLKSTTSQWQCSCLVSRTASIPSLERNRICDESSAGATKTVSFPLGSRQGLTPSLSSDQPLLTKGQSAAGKSCSPLAKDGKAGVCLANGSAHPARWWSRLREPSTRHLKVRSRSRISNDYYGWNICTFAPDSKCVGSA